jgi:type II secretory pathway pseudopilin PulG
MRMLPVRSGARSCPRAPCRPAFTRIELILVIAVTVFLLLLLFPILLRTTDRDRNQIRIACTSNLQQLARASQIYLDIEGSYPPGTVAGSAKEPTARFSCMTTLLQTSSSRVSTRDSISNSPGRRLRTRTP